MVCKQYNFEAVYTIGAYILINLDQIQSQHIQLHGSVSVTEINNRRISARKMLVLSLVKCWYDLKYSTL
jgi:hypothetical protein